MSLYPGEEIKNFGGYPCLIKLSVAARNYPLIVLIPGDANLARVFYGYPNGRPDDFLEYWLNKIGYSTLSISYPTDNKIFGNKTYPYYSIKDWANQAVITTVSAIQENKLSDHVILVPWSMGGIITAEYNKIAKRYHLKVSTISLAATPPIPNLIPGQINTVAFLPNGLSARVSLRRDRFLKFLAQQAVINKKNIIPQKIYLTDFMGNTPVALLNTAYTPIEKTIKIDRLAALKDSNGLTFTDYPLSAVIHGDSESDMQHVLADVHTWMFLNQQSLFGNYFNGKNLFALAKKKQGSVIFSIRYLEKNMACTVKGGHFFFIGHLGAERTSFCINSLYRRIVNLQNYLESFE